MVIWFKAIKSVRWFVLTILLTCCYNNCAAVDVKTYIPTKALIYIPTVKKEQVSVFPQLPIPEYMGGLIEQESCISLTHSRCWDPSSELKTSRERGCGLLQITKAFNKTGGLRFDTLKDLRTKYPVELNELTWNNITQRPDLQIRAGMLLSRDNYELLKDIINPTERLKMADSAYNGGYGNVRKARKACGLSLGCDPNIWFNNVENYLPQSRAALYGNRSAYDINQEHVRLIFNTRMPKYRPYFK